MPRFENIMDILVVGSSGAASLLNFPDDFDTSLFARQLRMLDKLKKQQKELGTFAFDEDGKVQTSISTTGTGKNAW